MEKIKNVFSKKNRLFIIIGIIVTILLILYFKAFYTKGVFFYDKFLKKEVINSEIHYINKKKDIHIIVNRIDNNNTIVNYNLPNNLRKEFSIHYSADDYWGFNIHSIKNKNGITIFEGKYRIDSMFLYDKKGEPIFNTVQFGIRNQHNDSYETTPSNILNFGFLANERLRGEAGLLMMAILLFFITFIDFKYPLFFFTLNHFLDVKDPEPTDFYLSMQKLGWVIMPVIAIILMIVSINL